MADVEKVKQGCKCCDHPLGERKCKGCPYAHFLTPYCNIHLAHDAMSVIEELQAEIERLQPKKGHWEMKEDPYGFFDKIPVCSECGCTNKLRKKTAFCDHCGADMREGDGE